MKIEIRKISFTPKEFERKFENEGENIVFNGVFYRTTGKTVKIEGNLTGTMILECNRTLEPFVHEVNEKLYFLVTEGLYKGFDEKYDIVESFDGFVDFDALIESELESIRFDYHSLSNEESEYVWEDKE